MNRPSEESIAVPITFLWLMLTTALLQGVIGAQSVFNGESAQGVVLLSLCALSLTICAGLVMIIADIYLFGPRGKH